MHPNRKRHFEDFSFEQFKLAILLIGAKLISDEVVELLDRDPMRIWRPPHEFSLPKRRSGSSQHQLLKLTRDLLPGEA